MNEILEGLIQVVCLVVTLDRDLIEIPALLTQPDSTTLIEPGFSATVHPTGNLLIEADA